jgi:hypothetical protein
MAADLNSAQMYQRLFRGKKFRAGHGTAFSLINPDIGSNLQILGYFSY